MAKIKMGIVTYSKKIKIFKLFSELKVLKCFRLLINQEIRLVIKHLCLVFFYKDFKEKKNTYKIQLFCTYKI